jgi:hypothetical protein
VHKHPDGFKEQKSNRRNAFGAVMEEQAHQLEESTTDADSMSHQYRKFALIYQL